MCKLCFMAEQSWSNCYRATVSVEYDYVFISFKVLTLSLSVFLMSCLLSDVTVAMTTQFRDAPHMSAPTAPVAVWSQRGNCEFPSLGKMPSVFCVCVCTRAVFDVDLIASRCVQGWLSGCGGFPLLSCYTGRYSLEVFSFSIMEKVPR